MAKKKKEAPKVEFAPIPPPAPELPPQAGIGPDVDYGKLPERQVNMDLLRAGVTEKAPVSASINKETTKEEGTAPSFNADSGEVFTRTPKVKSTTKSMSHSGTIKTRY